MHNFDMMRRTHFILLIARDLGRISKKECLEELKKLTKKNDFQRKHFPYSTSSEFVVYRIILKFTCIFIYMKKIFREIRQI